MGRIGRGAGGHPVRGFDHQGSMAPVMVWRGRRRRFELGRYNDEVQGKTIDLRNPLLFYFLFSIFPLGPAAFRDLIEALKQFYKFWKISCNLPLTGRSSKKIVLQNIMF